jgi:hypothetical protein
MGGILPACETLAETSWFRLGTKKMGFVEALHLTGFEMRHSFSGPTTFGWPLNGGMDDSTCKACRDDHCRKGSGDEVAAHTRPSSREWSMGLISEARPNLTLPA